MPLILNVSQILNLVYLIVVVVLGIVVNLAHRNRASRLVAQHIRDETRFTYKDILFTYSFLAEDLSLKCFPRLKTGWD